MAQAELPPQLPTVLVALSPDVLLSIVENLSTIEVVRLGATCKDLWTLLLGLFTQSVRVRGASWLPCMLLGRRRLGIAPCCPCTWPTQHCACEWVRVRGNECTLECIVVCATLNLPLNAC